MRQAVVVGAVLALVVIAVVILIVVPGRPAGPATLCGTQTTPVAGGGYIVQNNEYNSTADECVAVGDGTAFHVAKSSIDNPTDSLPGAYASIYQGCHWGVCTSGGLAAHPVQVAALRPGLVTTSWAASPPAVGASYYAAYDIWFNHAPETKGQPDCAELQVWLASAGPVRPFGTPVARSLTVPGGNASYDVWAGQRASWSVVTYDMTTQATSATGLDVAAFARDAASRGYLPESCYLISVEAGFGLWHGGAGLATTSFSVH